MLWIVTRSICLETWTSDQTSATPVVTSDDPITCSSCLNLLEEKVTFLADQDADKLAAYNRRLAKCQRSCTAYFSVEKQKKESSLLSKYRP